MAKLKLEGQMYAYVKEGEAFGPDSLVYMFVRAATVNRYKILILQRPAGAWWTEPWVTFAINWQFTNLFGAAYKLQAGRVSTSSARRKDVIIALALPMAGMQHMHLGCLPDVIGRIK